MNEEWSQYNDSQKKNSTNDAAYFFFKSEFCPAPPNACLFYVS